MRNIRDAALGRLWLPGEQASRREAQKGEWPRGKTAGAGDRSLLFHRPPCAMHRVCVCACVQGPSLALCLRQRVAGLTPFA